MLVLTRADVESVLTIEETVAAVEEGFRQLALGTVEMPQRAATSIPPHNGLHLSMPAYVGGDPAGDDPGTLTIKIVTVYPENPAKHGLPMIQGMLLLFDAATGALLAMMDAEHLTAMRTGASSGVATKYMARQDARVVTLFGAGAQAGPQLEAVCAVRPIEQVYVVTRSGAKDAAFCGEMAERLGIPVAPAGDARAAVQAADVICAATNAQTPVFDGAWLRPGTHINAVGAYTSTMRELDTTTVQRARLIVDHRRAAMAEAGDVVIPLRAGEIEEAHIAGELGQVVLGEVPGRTSADEITLFKSVGLAMQDAMTAARVYARAVAAGIGARVEL
jgi:alanine dehydrogenase